MPIPQLRLKKRKDDWRYRPLGGGNVRASYSPQVWRHKKIYRNQGKRPLLAFFKILIPLGILAFVFGVIFVIGLFAWYGRDLPNPDKLLERSLAQSTVIYDRTGDNILYEVHGDERRTMITMEEVPSYLKWATIVAEDRTFYEHKGFNFKRIVAAFLTNLMHFGKPVQGASTITQQFVKNAILTTEKRYSRKIKEVILSYQIERKFTKDEILKMYFNEIPYGSTAYGIEAASQIYLGKHTFELNLAEAATLAAIPQAPTYYFNNQDKLEARKNYILQSMVDLGYISPMEAEAATQIKVELKQRSEALNAPHFVMYVKELLSERYGERLVERGGLRVYTSLDLDKQKIAEAAIDEYAAKNESEYQATNAALVALDPKNGDILAMVGSRDFSNEEIDGQVNVVLRPRQPGSSFKPIVYAAAFIKGYTPNTILWDVVTTFKTETGKDYTPHNYDNKEHGPVTMKKALAGSLNIPAVKTIYLVGISRVLDLAENLGYTTFADRSRFGLSLVLGGGEVKLLEHASAFGVFSQEGIRQAPKAILKVVDASGKVLEEAGKELPGERVMEVEVCRQVTNILSDNNARAYIFGANNYLTLGNRPAAAKTGTTNDYHDAWTIGYTPSLVAGVWVGNSDNSPMKRGADGSVLAAPIWNKFMRQALEGTSVENFVSPAAIATDKPVLNGEIGSEVTVKIDKVSGNLATELTPSEMVQEKKFREMHSILHYVNKDDPRGPVPVDSKREPYYESWEKAVRDFLAREKEKKEKGDKGAFTYEAPPTATDDAHIIANKPVVTIVYPISEQVFETNILTARVSAEVPRGKISKVEYYVDGEFFAVNNVSPYNLKKLIVKFSNGRHILSVKVYDDAYNFGEASVYINIDLRDVAPKIQWLAPAGGAINAASYPINLQVTVPNPDGQRIGITKFKFYYQALGWPQARLLGMVTDPESFDLVALAWSEAPSVGNYTLFTEAEDYKGATYRSEIREVVVE